jgi:DNA-directed RNA polymerase beta' subunit
MELENLRKLIMRKKRHEKLISLDAPSNIINNEVKLIKKALVEFAADLGFQNVVFEVEPTKEKSKYETTKESLHKHLGN